MRPAAHSFLNGDAASTVTLPWKQLTSLTLTLHVIEPSNCASILRQTPNLVHCELDFIGGGTVNSLGSDIALPCLESLILRPDDNEMRGSYLESFIVPALSRLRIPETFLGTNAIESLEAFISQSGCKPQRTEKGTGLLYREAFPTIPDFSFDGDESTDSSDAESDSSSE
ncbi:hypothetical protein B0H13DRAFT_1903061 [Mycena leptocephala]|nr:hypothetical protein B0H13DRAFT_1903061 [Mycena leptocephala]